MTAMGAIRIMHAILAHMVRHGHMVRPPKDALVSACVLYFFICVSILLYDVCLFCHCDCGFLYLISAVKRYDIRASAVKTVQSFSTKDTRFCFKIHRLWRKNDCYLSTKVCRLYIAINTAKFAADYVELVLGWKRWIIIHYR